MFIEVLIAGVIQGFAVNLAALREICLSGMC